jgi:hypothetical protein
MNVSEIAYYCFLIIYKHAYEDMSSGMLKWRQVWEWANIHSEAASGLQIEG